MLIDQGTYGCVFSEPSPCISKAIRGSMLVNASKRESKRKSKRNHGRDQNDLAKIFRSPREADAEWRMVAKIAKIDPKQEYFVYGTELCDVSRASVVALDTHRACSIVNNNLHATFPQITMPHGGIPLDAYMLSVSSKINLKSIVALLRPCLAGVQKMAKHGLVHQDLKPNNILIGAAGTATRIIDFGLMVPVDKMLHADNAHVLRYWVLPPEYRLYKHYAHDRKGNIDLATLEEFVHRELDLLHIHFGGPTFLNDVLFSFWHSHCDYENELRQFIVHLEKQLHSMKNSGKNSGIHSLMTYMASSKIDVYSMGLVLVFCTQFSDEHKKHKHLLTDERQRNTSPILFKVQALIRGMTNPNPIKRWSATKCLQWMDSI